MKNSTPRTAVLILNSDSNGQEMPEENSYLNDVCSDGHGHCQILGGGAKHLFHLRNIVSLYRFQTKYKQHRG